jgi:FlaA1/EpsC-like NDP-sugar epimerase
MSKGGNVFVLDMGEPVRIVDLARNVIRLAGLVPDVDILISFTGLRSGEKLFEELIAVGENVAPTYHKKIKIFTGPPADRGVVEEWIAKMKRVIAQDDAPGVVDLLSEMVPEYTPSANGVIARKAAAHDAVSIKGSVHAAASSR